MTDTKIKEYMGDFGKICYVACVVKHTGQLICLRVSLLERDCAGLIDKTALKSKVQ